MGNIDYKNEACEVKDLIAKNLIVHMIFYYF